MHHVIKEFKAEVKSNLVFEDTYCLRLMHTLFIKLVMITYNCRSIDIKFRLQLRCNTDTNFDYMVYLCFMSSMRHSNNTQKPVAYANAALKKKSFTRPYYFPSASSQNAMHLLVLRLFIWISCEYDFSSWRKLKFMDFFLFFLNINRMQLIWCVINKTSFLCCLTVSSFA